MSQQLPGQATRASSYEAELRRVTVSSGCVEPKHQGALCIFMAPLSTYISLLCI